MCEVSTGSNTPSRSCIGRVAVSQLCAHSPRGHSLDSFACNTTACPNSWCCKSIRDITRAESVKSENGTPAKQPTTRIQPGACTALVGLTALTARTVHNDLTTNCTHCSTHCSHHLATSFHELHTAAASSASGGLSNCSTRAPAPIGSRCILESLSCSPSTSCCRSHRSIFPVYIGRCSSSGRTWHHMRG